MCQSRTFFSNDYLVGPNTNSPTEVLCSKAAGERSLQKRYATQLTGYKLVPILLAASAGIYRINRSLSHLLGAIGDFG